MSHTTITPTGSATDRPGPAGRAVLPTMAAAAGLSIAGNYFAQPLLDVLRDDLGLSTTTAGLLVAAGQIGYAIGLAVLVPLGDRFPRRGLAAVLMVATAALLAAAGAAPTGAVLLLATALAAVTSVGAQVLVPFAAELGGTRGSGRAVAVVMSGVLLGGLVGRAAAGLVADLMGWRSVYWITAALLLVGALVVVRALPSSRPDAAALPLGRLLRSTAVLLVELPALRRPVAVAALTMASYSVHLAALTLLLAHPPFSWSPTAIGMFALVGAAGPLSLPLTGRLVDRGRATTVLRLGSGAVVAGWAVMAPAAAGSTVALSIGLVLINLGQQAVLNASQTAAYALRPEARNRVNAVFMTLFFAAGAVGSLAAALLWPVAGWLGVCVLAAVPAAVVLGIALVGRGATRR